MKKSNIKKGQVALNSEGGMTLDQSLLSVVCGGVVCHSSDCDRIGIGGEEGGQAGFRKEGERGKLVKSDNGDGQL